MPNPHSNDNSTAGHPFAAPPSPQQHSHGHSHGQQRDSIGFNFGTGGGGGGSGGGGAGGRSLTLVRGEADDDSEGPLSSFVLRGDGFHSDSQLMMRSSGGGATVVGASIGSLHQQHKEREVSSYAAGTAGIGLAIGSLSNLHGGGDHQHQQQNEKAPPDSARRSVRYAVSTTTAPSSRGVGGTIASSSEKRRLQQMDTSSAEDDEGAIGKRRKGLFAALCCFFDGIGKDRDDGEVDLDVEGSNIRSIAGRDIDVFSSASPVTDAASIHQQQHSLRGGGGDHHPIGGSTASGHLPFPLCFLAIIRRDNDDNKKNNNNKIDNRRHSSATAAALRLEAGVERRHYSLAAAASAVAAVWVVAPLALLYSIGVWVTHEAAAEAADLSNGLPDVIAAIVSAAAVSNSSSSNGGEAAALMVGVSSYLEDIANRRASRRDGVIVGGLVLMVVAFFMAVVSLFSLFRPLRAFAIAMHRAVFCGGSSGASALLRHQAALTVTSRLAATFSELFLIKAAFEDVVLKMEKAKKFLPENVLAQLFPADDDDDGDDDDDDDDDEDEDEEGTAFDDDTSAGGVGGGGGFIRGLGFGRSNHRSHTHTHGGMGGDEYDSSEGQLQIAAGSTHISTHSATGAFGSQLQSNSSPLGITLGGQRGTSFRHGGGASGGGTTGGGGGGLPLNLLGRNLSATPAPPSMISGHNQAPGTFASAFSFINQRETSVYGDSTVASTPMAAGAIGTDTDTGHGSGRHAAGNKKKNRKRRPGSAADGGGHNNSTNNNGNNIAAGPLASLPSVGPNVELLAARNVSIIAFNLRDFHFSTHHADDGSLEQNYGKLLDAFQLIAKDHKGLLDSFHGDHFHFTFNAVRPCHSHATLAATAALKIVSHMSAQSSHHSAIGSRVSCGVATGRCLVGNLGSERTKRHSVIGTAYTQATVLERLCKRYGASTSVLLSSETAVECETHISFLYLDMIDSPGGRNQPVAAAKFIKSAINGGGGDEWMYELQEQDERSDYLNGNKAFKALLRGDVQAAKQYLSSFSNNKYVEAVAVKSRLQSFIDRGEIKPLDLGLYYNECILNN